MRSIRLFALPWLLLTVFVGAGCRGCQRPIDPSVTPQSEPSAARGVTATAGGEKLSACYEARKKMRPNADHVRFLQERSFYACVEAACEDADASAAGGCTKLQDELLRIREGMVTLYGITCPEQIEDWRSKTLNVEELEESHREAMTCTRSRCSEGDEEACRFASRLQRSFGNPSEAAALEARIAVIEEEQQARRKRSGSSYSEQLKQMMEESSARAKKACLAGHSNSCAFLAQQKQEEKDLGEARQYAAKACELDRRWQSASGGCFLLDQLQSESPH